MGDSRFEFSTKFPFPEYMWHLSNIRKHIDFSIAKNANLPSKSQWDETWDFVSKFQKLKFCQKWLDLRQISSRYHLSTLEITSWSKNPKIFFKSLKALCGKISILVYLLIKVLSKFQFEGSNSTIYTYLHNFDNLAIILLTER